MKQQDKLNIYKSFIIGIFTLLISCKENKSNTSSVNVKEVTISEKNKKDSNCFKEGDTTKMKDFYIKIKTICKSDSLQITKFFTKNITETYRTNFCSTLIDSFENKEGEVEFEVLKNDCIGVININSVKNYVEDGETYRNEYSLFLYVIKQSDSLKIDKIGGAG